MDRTQIVVTSEEQYVKLTAVTWNLQDIKTDTAHCLLGISSELGELESAVKKNIGYGKPLDLVNIKEELGDLLYFLYRLSDILKCEIQINNAQGHFELKIGVNNIKFFLDVCNEIRLSSIDVDSDNYKINNYFNLMNCLNKTLCLAWTFGFNDIFELMTTNIQKLAVRFPDKFDSYLVSNRDLEKERQVLDGNNSK